MSNLKTGFIGLGAMGWPMAGHLAAAGKLHCVWNRTAAKTQEFAGEHNVSAASSPAELAAECQVVLICVSADKDLLEVIEAITPQLGPGAIVVDHSTVAPATALQVNRQLATHGIDFLDAPISGGVEGARNGLLSIMVGGSAQVIQTVTPLFDCYAARISHMGDVGNGQATKAVNQVLIAGIAETVCEGLALAEQLKLPSEALLQVLQNGAAGSWFLDKRGATMLADDCDTGFKLELLVKDLRICRDMAATNQLSLEGVNRALDDYLQCMQAGDGQQDISALIRLKRKQLVNP